MLLGVAALKEVCSGEMVSKRLREYGWCRFTKLDDEEASLEETLGKASQYFTYLS